VGIGCTVLVPLGVELATDVGVAKGLGDAPVPPLPTGGVPLLPLPPPQAAKVTTAKLKSNLRMCLLSICEGHQGSKYKASCTMLLVNPSNF
jgi:hypothetical protein